MGLGEKVTLTLVIIIFIQIACRHCMPRTQNKASLKRYLDTLKPVNNNPYQTPFSPNREIENIPKTKLGIKGQNAKVRPNPPPKKSLYKTYNFPEIEYPLDNSPRDPVHFGMNYNTNNYQVNMPQKGIHDAQNLAISNLKKQIKMKRKLSSNRQMNIENSKSNSKMYSNNFVTTSETFPEVQYPLNTMETWGPNYWNYAPFNGIGQQNFNPKVKEISKSSFTKLTKAKANQFLKPYDELKEEQRRKSTENSKRSNVGSKGLNFTKTETCEKLTDDFISASILSSILDKLNTNQELKIAAEVTPSSKNTCSITEYPYESVPIPYKVNEQNSNNMCPTIDINNNTKANVLNIGRILPTTNSSILQLVQAFDDKTFDDKTCSVVPPVSPEFDELKTLPTYNFTTVTTDEDILSTLIDNAKSCITSTADVLSLPVSEDASADHFRNNISSLAFEKILDNTTTTTGPLNVRIPFAQPMLNVLSRIAHPTNMAPSNVNTAPGSTSIIIIPINNVAGKSQSQFFETNSESPIIVYIPATSTSTSYNEFVSPLLDQTIPNVMSNISYHNDKVSSNSLVGEILMDISNSGSSLPVYETLPTNSMCYNNDNRPPSFKVEASSNETINESLADNTTPVILTCTEQDPKNNFGLDMKSETLPKSSNFEQTVFDDPKNDVILLKNELYNQVSINELPMTARETNQDHLLPVVTKDYLLNHISTFSKNNVLEPTLIGISNDSLLVPNNDHHTSNLLDASTDSLPTKTAKTITISDIHTDSPLVPIHNTPAPLFQTSNDRQLDLPMDSMLPSTSPSAFSTDSLPQPNSNLSIPIADFATEEVPLPIDRISIGPEDCINNVPLAKDINNSYLSEPSTSSKSLLIEKTLSPSTVSYTSTDTGSLKHYTLPSAPLHETPIDNPLLLKDNTFPQSSVLDTPEYIVQQPPGSVLTLLPNTVACCSAVLDTPIEGLPLSIDALMLPMNPVGPDIEGPPVTEELVSNKPNILDRKSPEIYITKNNDSLPILLDKVLLHSTSSDKIRDDVPTSLNAVLPEPSDILCDFPENLNTTFLEPPTSQMIENSLPLPLDENLSAKDSPLSGLTRDALHVPETHSKISVLDYPNDDLPLPIDKMLTEKPDILTDEIKGGDKKETIFSDNANDLLEILLFPRNTAPTASKLQIFKTLLENVLIDISKDDFSTPINKIQSTVTTTPLEKVLAESSHFIDLTQKTLPLLVDKTSALLDTRLAGDPTLSGKVAKIFPVPEHEMITDISITKNIANDQAALPMDKAHIDEPDILTNEGIKNTIFSQDTDDKPKDFPLPKNKVPTALNLLITKAILKNLLSDITKGDFSQPIANSLPLSTKKLSSYSDMTEMNSPFPKDKILSDIEFYDNPANIFSCSEITEDDLATLVDKISNLDTPTNLWPLPMDEFCDKESNETFLYTNCTTDNLQLKSNKIPSASKLTITKALLENVLSDITQPDFSLPISEELQLTPSPTSKNKFLEFSHSTRTEKNLSSIPETMPGPIISPDKEISASKLRIMKALLENVLYDITKREFSLPIGKSVPAFTGSNVPTKDSTGKKDPLPETIKESGELSKSKILQAIRQSDNPIDSAPLLMKKTQSDTQLSEMLTQDLGSKRNNGFSGDQRYVG